MTRDHTPKGHVYSHTCSILIVTKSHRSLSKWILWVIALKEFPGWFMHRKRWNSGQDASQETGGSLEKVL